MSTIKSNWEFNFCLYQSALNTKQIENFQKYSHQTSSDVGHISQNSRASARTVV